MAFPLHSWVPHRSVVLFINITSKYTSWNQRRSATQKFIRPGLCLLMPIELMYVCSASHPYNSKGSEMVFFGLAEHARTKTAPCLRCCHQTSARSQIASPPLGSLGQVKLPGEATAPPGFSRSCPSLVVRIPSQKN